jgi:predicted TIM-barrel fold metal-dependent hydrolase
MIIDAQIHEPSVTLPWSEYDLSVRRSVLAEVLLDYMDAVGVNRALLFPIRDDPEWPESVAHRFPERIKLVTKAPLIAERPDVRECVQEVGRSTSHAGLRLVLGVPRSGEEVARYKAGIYDPLLDACQKHSVPLFLMATWYLHLVADIAARYPDLLIILDHLGMPQPPTQEMDSPPLKALPEVVQLARFPNIAMKFSGGPSLSGEPYPYEDLWPHLMQIVEGFGSERLMWGSDISRFDGRVGFERRPKSPESYPGKHTYAEALYYIRDTNHLRAQEKADILGLTARRLLHWR